MIAAGSLSSRVTFKERAAVPSVANTIRGGFTGRALTAWANYADSGRATPITLGDLTMSGRSGTLLVRDSSMNGEFATPDHRVVIDGSEFEIIGSEWPGDGSIKMSVVTVPSRATFRRETEQKGEVVTLRRVNPTGPATEITVRALVTGYLPEELVGGINQADRKVYLSVEDLESKDFPLPLKGGSTDSLMVRGRKMTIQDVDDSTRRIAGQLIAYRLRVSG
jgi:hypothetical protein